MDLVLNFLMGLEPGKMVALVMFAATVVLFPVVVKTTRGKPISPPNPYSARFNKTHDIRGDYSYGGLGSIPRDPFED